MSWFAGQDIKTVHVVTQGRNTRAQRLYQRCGFVTRSMELWYHRWFDNREENS
jgi:RimJ/RimL family protein N-acetyltransferase